MAEVTIALEGITYPQAILKIIEVAITTNTHISILGENLYLRIFEMAKDDKGKWNVVLKLVGL